jgi:hypothetical protein
VAWLLLFPQEYPQIFRRGFGCRNARWAISDQLFNAFGNAVWMNEAGWTATGV